MQYALYERANPNTPVSIHANYPAAEAAQRKLVDAGVEGRDLMIRAYQEHHAGEFFPGGVDLHLPGQ